MNSVNLEKFNNDWYLPGSKFKIIIWYFINVCFFKTSIPFPSSLKVLLLKLFSAKVGNRVLIKPCVNIKYPWLLTIGSDVWIGENVWIDNLAKVKIGDNVVISQGALLLTGNHDYHKEYFNLILGEIKLEEGAWVGAKSVVCPNVILEKNSILSVGSIATSSLSENSIYQGNPAKFKKYRFK